MPVFMEGNYIFVEPGQKCFEVSSNFTNYLELGIRDVTKYYLEAKVDNDEFKISGVLLDRTGNVLCRLKDNFIEQTEQCKKIMTTSGYRIEDLEGNVFFEIRVEGDLICHLKGTVYGDSDVIIAQDRGDKFIIFRGPAIIGKEGSAIGIKLD